MANRNKGDRIMFVTNHKRVSGLPIQFRGQKLYSIAALASDGQKASATVAADDEWKARTRLTVVQQTMRLSGQYVSYKVIDVSGTRGARRFGLYESDVNAEGSAQ